MMKESKILNRGSPLPFGTQWIGDSLNFAIYVPKAKHVSVCLFNQGNPSPIKEIPLYRTGAVWHVAIHSPIQETSYLYRIDEIYVLDPYATRMATPFEWATEHSLSSAQFHPYSPVAHIPEATLFDWEDDIPPQIPRDQLIIYEVHIRAFTEHPSSQVKHKGKFLGVIEKIPHLKELGVNAVELLPIWEFDESEYECCSLSTGKSLCNFWGYQPQSFFAPMNRYAVENAPREFKTMVKALHEAGIEVFLDVVFNHTGEGGLLGPSYSLKGIASKVYYLMDHKGKYLDFTGCGNTMNCNHPVVIEMILASLRYWVTEMHVDGFRFDLTAVLTRDQTGHFSPIQPLVDAISKDPILTNVKLIAEPWDVTGLYLLGQFYRAGPTWSEWNDKYRDGVRRFIRGAPNSVGDFATRLCGSQDIYGAGGSPICSVNFITAHDGFTLADLVSYNNKHNYSNGENNRDGTNNNESWNCGREGVTKNAEILDLRQRQMRNFLLALMVSRGVPMLHMGDEYGHTKYGNNNSWCHDDDINWFLWDKLQLHKNYYAFYRSLIQLRKENPILTAAQFLAQDEVVWHGCQPGQPDWSHDSHLIAYTLIDGNDKKDIRDKQDDKDRKDLYIAFNAGDQNEVVTLPEGRWEWLVDTAKEAKSGKIVESDNITLIRYSAVVLRRNNTPRG